MTGLVYALVVAYGYASSNFYMKKGMQKGAKDIGVLYTLIINATIATFIAIFLLIKSSFTLDLPGIIFFVLSGFMGPVIGRLTFYSAINSVGITLSSSIKITAPVFAAIIAFLALGETLSIPAITGMLIVMFGLYSLSQKKSQPSQPLSEGKETTKIYKIGIAFALASALSFATGNVFRKFGLHYIDSAILGLAISTAGSLFFYIIYFLIKGRMKEVLATHPEAKKNFILGGLFTTLATFCYFLSLKTIPVALTVTIANTEPIFVIFLSKYVYKLEDERLSINQMLSIALIFIGVLIITFF